MEDDMEARFTTGESCGREAEEWANAIISCQLCNSLADLEKKEDDGKNDLSTDIKRTIQNEVDTAEASIADALVASLANRADDENDGQTGLDTTQKEVKEEQQAEANAAGGSGRAVGNPTTMYVIKTWFKKVSSGVWNVVVSGGPEYCTDMIPKYPRIKFGKMKPGHPNWYMVQEIRNNCVTLHGVIKNTKCFCVYVLWGCHNWNRVKRCDPSWQRAKASVQERKYCFYFSNLKGGIWKPKRHPTNPLCKSTIAMHSTPKPQAMSYSNNGAINKKIKTCITNCQRASKYRGNYKGRMQCISNCKKIKPTNPPPPPPPPKKTMAECRAAGQAWCVKYLTKRGKAVLNRCKNSQKAKNMHQMHAFCVKLGMDMVSIS